MTLHVDKTNYQYCGCECKIIAIIQKYFYVMKSGDCYHYYFVKRFSAKFEGINCNRKYVLANLLLDL